MAGYSTDPSVILMSTVVGDTYSPCGARASSMLPDFLGEECQIGGFRELIPQRYLSLLALQFYGGLNERLATLKIRRPVEWWRLLSGFTRVWGHGRSITGAKLGWRAGRPGGFCNCTGPFCAAEAIT